MRQYDEMTGGAQCSSLRWGQEDEYTAIVESFEEGAFEVDLDLVDVSVVTLFRLEVSEPTHSDIEALNELEMDQREAEIELRELNAYYCSTRL